jgi:hypothetical protein
MTGAATREWKYEEVWMQMILDYTPPVTTGIEADLLIEKFNRANPSLLRGQVPTFDPAKEAALANARLDKLARHKFNEVSPGAPSVDPVPSPEPSSAPPVPVTEPAPAGPGTPAPAPNRPAPEPLQPARPDTRPTPGSIKRNRTHR